MQHATDDYRRDMDKIQKFIDSECVVDPNVKIKTKELYEAYKEWSGGGKYVLSPAKFKDAMEEKKFPCKKSGTNFFLGIQLLQQPTQQEDDWQ